jgi:hypothetical protein
MRVEAGGSGSDASTMPDGGAPHSSASADFAARCRQPGVIVCQGFDDASLFRSAKWPASGLYPSGAGSLGGSFDGTTSRSGKGSLMFTVPSQAGANSAGYWRQLFATKMSDGPTSARMFGAHTSFYVQYAQRFSPDYLTNKWPVLGGGETNWKQQIISNDSSTCGNVELTTVNAYNRGFPQMYSQCGADDFEVPIAGEDYLLEQSATSAGYDCRYHDPTPKTCFIYPKDIWATFYYAVSIGSFGQPDSTVDAWVSVDGLPYRQWIHMPGHTLDEDTPGADYDMVTLLPYMTGRDPSVSAGPTSYTWYDELIVSSEPIAAPTTSPEMP